MSFVSFLEIVQNFLFHRWSTMFGRNSKIQMLVLINWKEMQMNSQVTILSSLIQSNTYSTGIWMSNIVYRI